MSLAKFLKTKILLRERMCDELGMAGVPVHRPYHGFGRHLGG